MFREKLAMALAERYAKQDAEEALGNNFNWSAYWATYWQNLWGHYYNFLSKAYA